MGRHHREGTDGSAMGSQSVIAAVFRRGLARRTQRPTAACVIVSALSFSKDHRPPLEVTAGLRRTPSGAGHGPSGIVCWIFRGREVG